jgi:hypothetical protein
MKKKKTIKKVSKSKRLKPNEELFCRLYTQNSQYRSNGTMSYARAFQYDLDKMSTEKPLLSKDPVIYGASEYEKAHKTCSVMAITLLGKTSIQERLVVLMNQLLRDDIVDAELNRIIMQNDELPSKAAAIREYNKLKQRITDKVDFTTKGQPLNTFNETQLQRIAGRVVNGRAPIKK